jgi:beta-glucanase (GH16 family)
MKLLLTLTAILAVAHGVPTSKWADADGMSVTTVNKRQARAGELIFDENFDTLDFSVWQHERTMSGGGNWEFQVYDNSRTNSYVNNSILYLKPTLLEDRYGAGFVNTGTINMHGGAPADQCTNAAYYGCERMGANGALNPAMSARIRTVNSFSFKYGRVEVRAQMPTGDWLWPAIWMLPTYNAYGTWPGSGEIDIVEARGNARLVNNGVNIGAEQVASTMHWGPYWPYNGYEKTTWARNQVPGFNSGFHVYGVEWTPDYVKFTLDGTDLGTVTPPAGGFWEYGNFPADVENPWRFGSKMAPFDQEFYLIVNLAVGGTNGFFPDSAVNEGGAPKPWTAASGNAFQDFWNGRNGWYPTWQAAGENAALQVDYIRVYAL